MFLWRLICWLWRVEYWVRHWRSNVSFAAGVVLALIVLDSNPDSMVHRVLAAAIGVGCLIGGTIWDMRGTSG
jgi:hypothetical protein